MSDDKDAGTSSADKGKGNDSEVNSLLEDWDAQTGKKPETQTPSLGDTEYAVDKAVARVKGDLNVPDSIIRELLIGRDVEDKSFNEAWLNRYENREAWNAKLDEVRDELAEKLGQKKPDGEDDVTDDEGEIAAAARSARDIQPTGHSLDDVNWGQLSDAEFQQKKQEVFAAAKAGKL